MLTRTRHRGLEVLEAAATVPVMLLIMAAIVNLGMAIYAQQAAQNAANFGARMGSVQVGCRSCTAQAEAWNSINASGVHNPGVQILAPGGVVGSMLKVRVTGEMPNLMGPLMSFFGGSMSGPIQVSAEATFRAEGW